MVLVTIGLATLIGIFEDITGLITGVVFNGDMFDLKDTSFCDFDPKMFPKKPNPKTALDC
jgi:hypothetical protein